MPIREHENTQIGLRVDLSHTFHVYKPEMMFLVLKSTSYRNFQAFLPFPFYLARLLSTNANAIANDVYLCSKNCDCDCDCDYYDV
jgi:hypothetical protein